MTPENSCEEGRYLYCIINSGNEKSFGKVGVEDSVVSVVNFQDIGVVFHSCTAKPYQTSAKEKVEEWILAHQYVIDVATEAYGTVVPLTFDTIFKGNDGTLKEWLSKEYVQLKTLLAKLEGKAEYGVQIFLEKDQIEKTLNKNLEIQSLKNKLDKASSGTAYLLNKKIEKEIQLEKQLVVDRYAQDLYVQIENLVDEIKLYSTNKAVPDKWQDKQMILNISCLTPKQKIENLGNTLGHFKNEGFVVRFTGPWPPYSFAGQINESKKGNW